MLLKLKVVRRWYVVGSMWEVGNEKQGRGTGGWGLGDERLPRRRRVPASLAQFALRLKKACQHWRRILSLSKRNGNVVENKGRLWKTRRESGNITENKGSYAAKAGMFLKRKEVDDRS